MKKILFLFLCLILTTIPVWGAYGISVRGINYTIENGKAEVSGREKGNSFEIVMIPEYTGDAKVTKIRDKAFKGDPYLAQLIVYDNVTDVGMSAFESCSNLTTVTFETGLMWIRCDAFRECANLTSVTLPASLSWIETGAFAECDNLKVYFLGSKAQWDKISGGGKRDISRVEFAYDSTSKSVNPLKVKGKTVTVKKESQTLPVTKIIKFVKKGKGKLTYSISSGNKHFKINKTTGTLTIKKGLKKGTYKIKVKVRATGTKKYKAGSKAATVTVRVKE